MIVKVDCYVEGTPSTTVYTYEGLITLFSSADMFEQIARYGENGEKWSKIEVYSEGIAHIQEQLKKFCKAPNDFSTTQFGVTHYYFHDSDRALNGAVTPIDSTFFEGKSIKFRNLSIMIYNIWVNKNYIKPLKVG